MAVEQDGKRLITVIKGDGIGPEVVGATMRVMLEAGAKIAFEEQLAGAEVFRAGQASGVPHDTIESIRKTGVALKGPLETPVGYGEKSANVTLRKQFETFGNLRPVRELPGVVTPFSGRGIDLVVVRENVEDVYAGIEHMQTPGVAQCLKLMSRKGCEKIVRLAFAFAQSEGRKKVHCATKANIMKFTEGLLKRTFEEIAPEFPDIHAEHIIIDNCAHQLVRRPEQFDVIVTANMNGDILSDLTSGLTGGLGLAPSSNIGNGVAMFEAVHGSAPDIAGQGKANPTALMLSGVMLLRHIGQFEAANCMEQAILLTLAQGTKTGDIAEPGKAVSTDAFTNAVIVNLNHATDHESGRTRQPLQVPQLSTRPDFVSIGSRRVVGCDLFVESALSPDELGRSVENLLEGAALHLKMISNRGMKVYPPTGPTPDCTDQYRCRIVTSDSTGDVDDKAIMDAVQRVSAHHAWAHIEKLQDFDGKPAYTKAQGED